jgi:hypothetical protein
MEVWGFEPQTFSMPLRRAPNCATPPNSTLKTLYVVGAIIQRYPVDVKRPGKIECALGGIGIMEIMGIIGCAGGAYWRVECLDSGTPTKV